MEFVCFDHGCLSGRDGPSFREATTIISIVYHFNTNVFSSSHKSDFLETSQDEFQRIKKPNAHVVPLRPKSHQALLETVYRKVRDNMYDDLW